MALGDSQQLQIQQQRKIEAIDRQVWPAIDVRLDLDALAADIAEVQGRIKKAFYANLFLMMAESDCREITARESDERRESQAMQAPHCNFIWH